MHFNRISGVLETKLFLKNPTLLCYISGSVESLNDLVVPVFVSVVIFRTCTVHQLIVYQSWLKSASLREGEHKLWISYTCPWTAQPCFGQWFHTKKLTIWNFNIYGYRVEMRMRKEFIAWDENFKVIVRKISKCL